MSIASMIPSAILLFAFQELTDNQDSLAFSPWTDTAQYAYDSTNM